MGISFEKTLFFILTTVAFTQANAKEMREIETALNRVTITATKLPIRVDEAPVSVDIVTGDDIGSRANVSMCLMRSSIFLVFK